MRVFLQTIFFAVAVLCVFGVLITTPPIEGFEQTKQNTMLSKSTKKRVAPRRTFKRKRGVSRRVLKPHKAKPRTESQSSSSSESSSTPETSTPPFVIQNVTLTHSNCQYKWHVTAKNMGSTPLSGQLVVQGGQREHSGMIWKGAGGKTVPSLNANQSKTIVVGWARDLKSTEYQVALRLNNADVDVKPFSIPPIALEITNLQVSHEQGVNYTWTAAVQNNSPHPVCFVKAEVLKKNSSNAWVPAGLKHVQQMAANTSSTISGTLNANDAKQLRVVVFSKAKERYTPYIQLASLDQSFSPQHSAADEKADNDAQAAQAAAQAQEDARYLELAKHITLKDVSLTHENCLYKWHIKVTNNNNDPFERRIIAEAQQRKTPNATWQPGGSKVVGTLAPHQTKTLTVGWVRKLDAIESKISLTYKNDIIQEQDIVLPPTDVIIENPTFTKLQDGQVRWESVLRNQAPYQLCYVKVTSEKGGSSWTQASPKQENLAIPANSTKTVAGTFNPSSASKLRLSVFAKAKSRYVPYVKITQKEFDIP